MTARAPAAAAFTAFFAASFMFAAVSCSDDLPDDRGNRMDGGLVVGDAGDGGQLEGCPEGEPKVGEGCPVAFYESGTCTYVVGTCNIPGGTANEYVTFCCVGKVWATCGGKSTCDYYDGGLPPDAFIPPDRPADGGDASSGG